MRVKDNAGNDVANKMAEIGVGEEPRCVAVSPNDRFAYVTNGISGTVSVVNLSQQRVVATIEEVGTEPRGCALTPNGTLLYVANHTEGTVSIIDTGTRTVVGRVVVGRNPAIAITNNGDGVDGDETVFVTQIFAELNPDFPIRSPSGVKCAIWAREVFFTRFRRECQSADHQNHVVPLSDSGFTANRVNFCVGAHPAHQRPRSFARIQLRRLTRRTSTPRRGVPNQLLSALIRGNRLYLPNIAPSRSRRSDST